MRIGAALSTDPDAATAAEAAVDGARSQIGGAEVSLAVVVASRQHAPSAEAALETVRIKAGPERVIGCVAETVVGGDREVEEGPAVAVWLACLPEPVETFHMEFVRTSEGGVFGGYRFEEAGPGPYLLIGDPFSFPTDLLLGHLNERVPGTVLMGGMASGGMRSGDTRLFLDDRVVDTGAIGARLPGIAIRALVPRDAAPSATSTPSRGQKETWSTSWEVGRPWSDCKNSWQRSHPRTASWSVGASTWVVSSTSTRPSWSAGTS